jgi:hypothetical protein
MGRGRPRQGVAQVLLKRWSERRAEWTEVLASGTAQESAEYVAVPTRERKESELSTAVGYGAIDDEVIEPQGAIDNASGPRLSAAPVSGLRGARRADVEESVAPVPARERRPAQKGGPVNLCLHMGVVTAESSYEVPQPESPSHDSETAFPTHAARAAPFVQRSGAPREASSRVPHAAGGYPVCQHILGFREARSSLRPGYLLAPVPRFLGRTT